MSQFRSFRTNVTRALAEIKKGIPTTFQIFSMHPVDNYHAKKKHFISLRVFTITH